MQIGEDAQLLLAQVVQVSTDGIFTQDLDGVVTTWNQAAADIYGYSADDMIGHHASELLPDRTRDDLVLAQRRALNGHNVQRFDTWHLRRDAVVIPVSMTVSALRGADGDVIGTATSVSEISDRVFMAADLEAAKLDLEVKAQALERSNRDLEQFAYVASHDLSEPLRVMSGFVGQFQKRYAGTFDERGERYMHHILEASKRMRSLIDDLLEFSRFLRAEQVPVKVNVNRVADDVIASLAATIQESGAQVTVKPIPAIRCDRRHVHSLLLNLVTNALKFQRPGVPPIIEIKGKRDGALARISVADNGIGISPEYREKIFGMFQRLHLREDFEGTGIGLAIVQQIVDLHGGSITAQDTRLGGTKFVVTLPLWTKGEAT